MPTAFLGDGLVNTAEHTTNRRSKAVAQVERTFPRSHLSISVGASPATIDYARTGHRLVCTFKNWLDLHLTSGELVPVLSDWLPQVEGPRLYFPNRFVLAPLRAFVDLITEAQYATGQLFGSTSSNVYL